MSDEKVLVTGASGYLGGRLLQHLASAQRFSVIAGSRRDLADEASMRRVCDGMSQVVHLAAPNEVQSASDPIGAIEATVAGTAKLVAAARAQGIRRFLYLSTAHVYGSPLTGTIDERTATFPVHPYAITHRAAEDFALAAASSDMEVVVLRLSNAVGAPAAPEVDRWTLLVNDLCRQAVTSKKLVLRSSGLQWRDFIPMSDACRAIEHFLARSRGAASGVFNVGAGKSELVIDVVERVRRAYAVACGGALDVTRAPPAEGEPGPPLVFSVERLTSTGFQANGSLDAEIRATLTFCQRFCS